MSRPRTVLLGLILCVGAAPACGGASPQASYPSGYGRASRAESASVSTASGAAAPSDVSLSAAPAAVPGSSGGTTVSAAARTMPGVAIEPRGGSVIGAVASPAQATEQSPAPMLIYVAQLSLTVEAVPAAIDHAIEQAVAAGGHLASRNDGSVQVRVPSARFRTVLAQFEALGTVVHREVQAEDVSEQFHDLEVQLTNLRAVRARLQEFLAHTRNMAEMLTIEHELERVGGQIDQIEGRMRFLSNRAAFSTITLSVAPTPRTVAIAPPPPPPPQEVALPFDWLTRLGLPALLQLR